MSGPCIQNCCRAGRRLCTPALRVHENLLRFLRQRSDVFPFRRELDLRHFVADTIGRAVALFPVPAKIFLLDELEPKGYGFPLIKTPAVDELETRMQRWLDEETFARGAPTVRTTDSLNAYREQVLKLSRNAYDSSVLADYHSAFWLLHTQQTARLFTAFVRRAMDAGIPRDDAERLRYALAAKWAATIRETVTVRGYVELALDNLLLVAEEFVSPDLRELRGYFLHLRRDYTAFRKVFDGLRTLAADLTAHDRLLRRALEILGYPEAGIVPVVALLDSRVRDLLESHSSYRAPGDTAVIDVISRKVLELFVVQALRRGLIWMSPTAEGENLGDDGTVYSRAIRPMNFGRRGVVEPIVYRYGLVYDITSFTETLGEIARGGQGEEQTSYRQMLEFQRELVEITRRHGLQFEKFLGDGAFYTSRRATRSIHAAIVIQQFYSDQRRNGFAFNRGMRIALNYGYYRLLPMQVSADGTQLMEFYGPGIVELSRLTTGKTTKEVEDFQHLLLTHGYDQNDVYRFFAPLARSVDGLDSAQQQREFYAYVNENGHLVNEGIVVSIPFLRQLSTEIIEDGQKLYRLVTPWSVYLGFAAGGDSGGYIGIRLLGSVSLKGIGAQEIGEVIWTTTDQAEISMIDEAKPLLQLLQLERHRTSAHRVGTFGDADDSTGNADLVVCEAQSESNPVILVGEWDPLSQEVRRPIRLDGTDAERYGLAVPLTAEAVELQMVAYQKLYKKLSRLETLPSFSVDAIRHNTNFSGFIIGATVERL
jgi:hypothetical protein